MVEVGQNTGVFAVTQGRHSIFPRKWSSEEQIKSGCLFRGGFMTLLKKCSMGLRQGARRRGSIIKPLILQREASLVKRAFWHFGRDSSEKLAKGQSARCLRDPVGAGRTRQANIPQLPTPQFNHRNKLVYIKMSKLHLMKGILMSKTPFFGNPSSTSFS